MIQMSHAFARMNQSLGKNLNSVNNHINSLLSEKGVVDEEPELESLSLILNALTLKTEDKKRDSIKPLPLELAEQIV